MTQRNSENSGSRCNILVSVDADAHDALDQVASALRAKGMKIVDVLPLSGVVTGEARETDLAALRKVPGVSAIEIDSIFTAES